MDGDEWIVLVPDAAVRRGRAALRAHDEEGSERPTRRPPRLRPSRTAWITGLAAGALLFGFFFVTGPPAASSSWAARGAAVSGSMLNGEPWRAVTALTLHVDLVHVLGNAIATALLLPPIIRRLGPGIGLTLVLLAGRGGESARGLGAGTPARGGGRVDRHVRRARHSRRPAPGIPVARGPGAGPAVDRARHQRAAAGDARNGAGHGCHRSRAGARGGGRARPGRGHCPTAGGGADPAGARGRRGARHPRMLVRRARRTGRAEATSARG